MNERILELADKAIEDMPGAWNIPDEFCEKFAELIVKECAEVIFETPVKSTEVVIMHVIRDRVKEHFGMSEKPFSELLREHREKKRLEEVQRTGFEGYCICCGAPSFVGKEWIHNKECIHYHFGVEE